MLYSPSVPWPSWPYCGKARGEDAAVLAADPRGELRAAAHRGGAGDACALHRKRADVVLLGFGLGDGAHPELAVFVGAPRVRVAVVGDDHGVTLAAGTGDDAVPSARASTTVGVARLLRSPWPSWPVSLRPQVNARPSSAMAMQCAAALPPHTAEMGTPARVEMREGSITFGVAESSCEASSLGRRGSAKRRRVVVEKDDAPDEIGRIEIEDAPRACRVRPSSSRSCP